MRILVVDDSVDVHHQLRVFLTADGHGDLAFVFSAREAYELLGLDDDAPTTAAVDLVLMDIEMGEMGGIEATRRLKADPRYQDVPVIMITADTTSESLQASFEAGAVDYITKPIRKIELLARVRSFLRLREEVVTRKRREQDLLLLTEELARANDALQKLATRDGLTGVSNRRYFDEMIAREWKASARRKMPVGLLMLDVDFFKLYNDQYGHLEGDRCLQAVANALRDTVLRPCDVVSRYGGEEFAVVLPETDEKGAEEVARLIHDAVQRQQIPHARSSVSAHVTVSIGVACMVASSGESHERLIQASDQVLYLAKNEGRNCWRVYRD